MGSAPLQAVQWFCFRVVQPHWWGSWANRRDPIQLPQRCVIHLLQRDAIYLLQRDVIYLLQKDMIYLFQRDVNYLLQRDVICVTGGYDPASSIWSLPRAAGGDKTLPRVPALPTACRLAHTAPLGDIPP